MGVRDRIADAAFRFAWSSGVRPERLVSADKQKSPFAFNMCHTALAPMLRSGAEVQDVTTSPVHVGITAAGPPFTQ
jgi:hypothetical protein